MKKSSEDSASSPLELAPRSRIRRAAPWYSNLAPISWLVQRDVDEGREELNFSEWNRAQEGEESAETVQQGSMPPRSYLLTHPGC